MKNEQMELPIFTTLVFLASFSARADRFILILISLLLILDGSQKRIPCNKITHFKLYHLGHTVCTLAS